jgi:putative nucleotidyltransferase with HDIG domain
MTDPDRRADERRWRPRPLLSFALRFVSVLVPAAAGAASAYGFVFTVPIPNGPGIVLWGLGLALTSTIATALAERIGRRVIPLAMLLRLSLVFPDRAPSRFAMARGAGNVRQLERRIKDAREHGIDEAPVRAAEQILSLVAALSAHDRKTRGHSERVRAFTDLVADEIGLADDDRERLRWAALLHDIGKLHVPSRILNKPGRPEPREWETLKRHPVAGAQIAAPLMPWLGAWGQAIEEHHERFDGDGYPNGIGGGDLSLGARIVSVADSFEVMTAARSYKKPMSVPAARRELAACAGGQFDPDIVRAFLNVSLGRLWWTVGPTSWTALLPVLGPIQRAGGQLAGAARGAAAAIAVTAGGLLPILTGIAAAAPPGVSAAASPRVVFSGGNAGGDPTRVAPHIEPGEGDHGRPDHVPPPHGTDEEGDGAGGSGVPLDDPTGPVDQVADTVDHVVKDTAAAANDLVGAASDVVGGVLSDTAAAAGGILSDPVEALADPVDGVTGTVGGLLGG